MPWRIWEILISLLMLILRKYFLYYSNTNKTQVFFEKTMEEQTKRKLEEVDEKLSWLENIVEKQTKTLKRRRVAPVMKDLPYSTPDATYGSVFKNRTDFVVIAHRKSGAMQEYFVDEILKAFGNDAKYITTYPGKSLSIERHKPQNPLEHIFRAMGGGVIIFVRNKIFYEDKMCAKAVVLAQLLNAQYNCFKRIVFVDDYNRAFFPVIPLLYGRKKHKLTVHRRYNDKIYMISILHDGRVDTVKDIVKDIKNAMCGPIFGRDQKVSWQCVFAEYITGEIECSILRPAVNVAMENKDPASSLLSSHFPILFCYDLKSSTDEPRYNYDNAMLLFNGLYGQDNKCDELIRTISDRISRFSKKWVPNWNDMCIFEEPIECKFFNNNKLFPIHSLGDLDGFIDKLYE